MMQSEAVLTRGPEGALLPPARGSLPTLPFELEEYARWSSLPDADDELVFEAGPRLSAIRTRIPYVATAEGAPGLTRAEALMLSLVDGISPVSILVQLVGIDPEDALVVLCDLYARGLVAFD